MQSTHWDNKAKSFNCLISCLHDHKNRNLKACYKEYVKICHIETSLSPESEVLKLMNEKPFIFNVQFSPLRMQNASVINAVKDLWNIYLSRIEDKDK